MSLGLLLVFFHLAFMFTAVSLSYGSQLLLLFAIRSNRAENVRSVTGATQMVGTVVPPLFVIGGLFGLAAAWVFGYPLLAPWLVIAYLAFAVLAVSGVRLTGPNYDRLRAATANSETGPLSPATRAVTDGIAFRACDRARLQPAGHPRVRHGLQAIWVTGVAIWRCYGRPATDISVARSRALTRLPGGTTACDVLDHCGGSARFVLRLS